jgi:hypothetical protein
MSDLHPSDWRRALGASFLALTWLLALGVHAQTGAPAPEAPTGRIAKQAATTTRDMVAAANPLAADCVEKLGAPVGRSINEVSFPEVGQLSASAPLRSRVSPEEVRPRRVWRASSSSGRSQPAGTHLGLRMGHAAAGDPSSKCA